MNILAKRANGIFIVAPIIIISYILMNFLLSQLSDEGQAFTMIMIFGVTRYRISPIGALYFGYTYIVAASVIALVCRLFVCPVVIEYDECGIYVYRKFKPTEIIRYEQMWNSLSLGELDFRDAPDLLDSGLASEGVHSARGVWGTGTLRIRTNKKTIRLYGVKNVLQVEKALNSLIEENRRNFINEL